MAYSNDVVRRASARLAEAKADRESMQQARMQQVYSQMPRIRQIDMQMRQTMALAAQAAFTRGTDVATAMEQAKQANLTLQAERKALLEANFPPDFLNEEPICPLCGGNGYIGTAMCRCLQELCREEQKKEIAVLASDDQTFGNFRLDYYSSQLVGKHSPRSIMERTFDTCRRYAANFSPAAGNLLFSGGTGLGKTYLSACVAREVTEKGFSVAYETAAHLFSKLEKNRFNPDEASQQAVEKVEKADLLIIDDLGTELPGNFVTAALYALVNDRLLAGKPMVISTNLTIEEVGRRYSPQIASRLQGNFMLLPFVGQDIRILKNK